MRTSHPLYLRESEITQKGQDGAKATGKLVHKPELFERTYGDRDG